ncbi:hypothetical protein BGZ73_001706 [Actinomortierella ambigua]|nr:hypothetical protein BGZ73_001706 [Actinomortierella ambigua]
MFTRQEPLDDDEPLLPLVSQPGMKDAAHLEDPNVSIGSNTSTGCTSSTSTVVASSSTSTPIKDSDGFGLDLGLDDVAVSPSPEAMEQNERRPSIALSISSAHSDEDDVPTPEALREAARDKRRLKLAIGLCTTFFCVELAGGIVTDSLALLSDSFHLLTDITSFCISLAAIYLSQRLPTATHTFGYHRAEVLGALFSIFLIWGLTCLLVIEAFDRIRHPLDIDGKTMSIVAGLGVFVNICLMFVLGGHHHHHHGEDDHHHHGHGHEEEGTHAHSHAAHHRRHHHHSHGRDVSCHEDEHDLEPLSKHNSQAESEGMLHHRDDDEEEEDDALRVGQRHMNLNITAATLHVLGDLLSSIGVLISSLLITFFPSWTILDPICTFIFSFLVILTTIGVFKRSVSILMERVPNHLSVEETREAIRAVPGVLEVKRIHLWSLTLGQTALTARVYLQPDIHDTAQAAKVIRATRRKLRQQYGIRQSTIQFETLQALGRSSSRQLQQQCLEDESSSSKSSLSSSHDHDHGHDHHHSHGHTHSRSHVHTHSHHHRGPSDGRAPERHDTEGAMQFSLVDTGRLDLASYQRSLMRLATALARRGQPLSPGATGSNPGNNESNVFTIAKRKCAFFVSTPSVSLALSGSSSGGGTAGAAVTTNKEELAYALTFVSNGMLSSLPNFYTNVSAEGSALSPSSSSSVPLPPPTSTSSMDIDSQPIPQDRTHHQSPPSSPQSPTSPVFALPNGHRPPRYLLRLPLDPLKSPIESRLSAKRLGAADVHLLDGILRRLCDATPGAFRLFYSDGLSGMEHGNAIVYDGRPPLETEPSTAIHAATMSDVVEGLKIQHQHGQQRQQEQQQHHHHPISNTEKSRERSKEDKSSESDDDWLHDDGFGDNEFEIMLAGMDNRVQRSVGSLGAEDAHGLLWAPTLGL